MTGIYKIENLVNRKVYIGQAIDINRRLKEHIFLLNNNKHYNKHLQNAWNKYGEQNFKFKIVEKCDKSELNEKEIMYIKKSNANNLDWGYNLTIGGESTLGYTHTEETKLKLSNIHKGRKTSEETKQKLSNINKGKHLSKQTKQKISIANKGKCLSKEHIQKLRNINKGKNVSEETRQKMKDAWKIRRQKGFSDETRQKMSLSHIGHIPWNKGLKGSEVFSDEIRQKLSEDTSNRKWVHKGSENRYIKYWEVSNYLSDGYILGRGDISKCKGRIWVNNGNKSKMIYPEQLEEYVNQGYKIGCLNKRQNKEVQECQN